jgi:hypothetical protein
MDPHQFTLLKLLTAPIFGRSPRPQVDFKRLVAAHERLGLPTPTPAQLRDAMQMLKGRGSVNTQPKILLREELETCRFEVWITPLGRDHLAAARAEQDA